MGHKKKILSTRQRRQQKRESKIARAEVRGGKTREKKTRERKVTTLPTIKLEKKKTGISAFRERPTLAGKAIKTLTSGKTTAALATTLSVIAPFARTAKAIKTGIGFVF